jgi:Zn-dependent protease
VRTGHLQLRRVLFLLDHPSWIWQASGGSAEGLLIVAIGMNIALCVFNFLPIPPLDGAGVVEGILPYRLRPLWEQYLQLGSFVLIGVIVLNSFVYRGALFAAPIAFFMQPITALVRAVAGG